MSVSSSFHRSFSLEPESSDVVGTCMSGSCVYQGRRYEFIYAGKGVFVGGFNVMRRTALKYAGKYYLFEEYIPKDECLFGMMHIYYVKELSHVLSPVPLLPNKVAKAGFEVCGEYYPSLQAISAGGGDRFSHLKAECKAAERACGLSKFRVPKNKWFNCKKFWNEIVPIVVEGKEYPGWLSYHKSQDLTRSPYIGSIRVPSVYGIENYYWRRA